MTSQSIVDLLNELLAADSEAVNSLFRNRVSCNQAIADHPTVTVDGTEPEGPWTLGLLGLLEGIVGIDGQLIASTVDDDKGITGFKRIAFSEVKREPVQYIPGTGAIQ